MNFSNKLDQLHLKIRQNKWMRYFTVFTRIALAFGFIFPGFVKVNGERFTDLSCNHPLGHYLEVLFTTGYYYTFIGVLQMLAAILLLIPRTAALGVTIYFPIILNICILSFAVRFEGSLLTSPLMVIGCLYLFCWDYHKFKYILPFKNHTYHELPKSASLTKNFPIRFFAAVFATFVLVIFLVLNAYKVKPRNTLPDCRSQFEGKKNEKEGFEFCDCVHLEGKPLGKCLDNYEKDEYEKMKNER